MITTSLAAAALMAGPAATWALDVTGVTGSSGATDQVTQAAQTVVSSTEQTAATTVTNAATTTQTAVQQTVAPVTNQVQSAAGAVASAPKRSAPAPAGAAPVQKKQSAGTHAAAPVRNPARQTGAVQRAVSSLGARAHAPASGGAASRAVASAPAVPGRPLSSTAPAMSAPGPVEPAPSCTGNGVLDLLSPVLVAAPNLGGLVTVVCNAAATLDLTQLTPTGTSAQQVTSPAGVLGAFAAVLAATSGRLHVLTAVADRSMVRASGSGLATGGPHPAGGPAGVGGPVGVATSDSVRYASVPYADAVPAASAHQALSEARHGGGLFHTSITGTELVFALLVLDWAFLVAVLMWRMARRRPVARLLYRWRPLSRTA